MLDFHSFCFPFDHLNLFQQQQIRSLVRRFQFLNSLKLVARFHVIYLVHFLAAHLTTFLPFLKSLTLEKQTEQTVYLTAKLDASRSRTSTSQVLKI
mmetsp:Transcript_16556/g.21921  ORF Transcript_16556/g.21921 Transcript_16556/m.21921 type:complete len:96 (-) Transcript_16556:1393-1680(-)